MGRRFVLLAFVCVLVFMTRWANAQEVTVTGKVTDEAGAPLPGANVFLVGYTYGAATNVGGVYSFLVSGAKMMGQEVVLKASFIGYRSKSRRITLAPGTMEHDFALPVDVLGMEETVVTGVIGETPKEKLAFSVARVGQEQLQLAPATSAVASIQGKVAGAQVVKGSGRPGDPISVRLRGSTSINKSSEPLYIVDGVILGANQVDVDALDLESVEVVKGAAAASPYGARAHTGVVQMKTSRGNNLPLNQTRITVRNEYGLNQLAKKVKVSRHHEFKVNANGDFVDDSGNVVDFADAVLDDDAGYALQDNEFKGPLYDHMDLFFDPGNFYTNSISISQNSQMTNFRASFANFRESGIITGMDGFSRKNVRLNLDHKLREGLDFSMSGYYATSRRDDPIGAIDPLYGLMFLNPTANLLEPNADGTPYKIQPDPRTLEENPLYFIRNAELEDKRQRLMGSFGLRYSPLNWFDLEGNLSYDRSDRNSSDYYHKGFKTIDASTLNDGEYTKSNALDQAINASLTGSVNRTFGAFATRTKLGYLWESTQFNSTSVTGNNLTVNDVRDLSVVQGEKVIDSSIGEVKSLGYYFITGADYRDKYIADFQVRRDGSSLFGPEERWNTYFRVSGAYRVSQEPWWFTSAINEFKLRYSYGTAGGRPSFSDQYETFSVASGVVSKATLGNKKLKPEFATEQEAGVDIALFDKVSLELTYAKSVIEDQLLAVPLPGFYGFASQWQNAGTLESNTYEANLHGSLLRTGNMNWSASLIFDRTRQKITEFDLPAYRWGPEQAFYNRKGEIFGVMYGRPWITSRDELPANIASRDQFQVNDDGYLVAVGSGNNWTDGVAKNMWGKKVTIDGVTYDWGMPIAYVDAKRSDFHKIGNVTPDFSLGLSSTFRWKGLSLYALFDAQIGGDIYNLTRQWSYRELRHGDVDQAGKPAEKKKPIDYYSRLYATNAMNSHFVEDGTYVKFRELNVSYTLDRGRLQKLFGGFFEGLFHRVTVGVIGRNLLTWSDYSGFDPEVGSYFGGNLDATLVRFDGFGYPNFRTFTGVLELEF